MEYPSQDRCHPSDLIRESREYVLGQLYRLGSFRPFSLDQGADGRAFSQGLPRRGPLREGPGLPQGESLMAFAWRSMHPALSGDGAVGALL